jgi:hypothetical protein
MTQALLAQELVEKLGFIENPEKGKYRKLRGGKVKGHPRAKRSVILAPPDFLLQRPAFLHFNPSEGQVYPQQIEKLQDETGLDYASQRDLAQCRLDREVAKLLFYCHRIVEITKDQGTMGLLDNRSYEA